MQQQQQQQQKHSATCIHTTATAAVARGNGYRGNRGQRRDRKAADMLSDCIINTHIDHISVPATHSLRTYDKGISESELL